MVKRGTTKQAAPAEAKPTPFIAKKRNYGIGGYIQPKRDLSRFVKWPKYVKIQRQRKILHQRLKVPPSVNQFNTVAEKGLAIQVFRFLNKYRPEDKAAKKTRLQGEAEAQKAGESVRKSKPNHAKFGINHIAQLVESKKAKFVAIANDVEPLEVVLWLPALCRKMGVPYCIVKGKARLGTVVHQKNATAVAITDPKKEDQHEFSKLVEACNSNFNEKADEFRKRWGGGIMGLKTQAMLLKREQAIAKEASKRAGI